MVNQKLLSYSTVDGVAVVDDNGNEIIYYFNRSEERRVGKEC